MFDLAASEDLRLIAETARSFAADALAPRIREAEAVRGVGSDVHRGFAEIGLAGLELPEALGGAGLGALARALVNEELGAADPGAALALDPLGPALYPLLELAGSTWMRELALPLFESEGSRAVLVWQPDSTLRVEERRVHGAAPWVPADRVDLVVALGPAGAFAVREGFVASRLAGAGLRAAGASELRFEDAPVAALWSDAAGAARALARARIHVASLLLGVLRHAADFSRGYALEREAFGRPIAHHQALAFLIVDMHAAVEGLRLLVHDAAWRLDQGLPAEAAAAAAFAEAVEASTRVAPNGVQILGGHGFMQDYPVEKAMREARALGLLLGGVDAAREEAGRALCAEPTPVALSSVEAV